MTYQSIEQRCNIHTFYLEWTGHPEHLQSVHLQSVPHILMVLFGEVTKDKNGSKVII